MSHYPEVSVHLRLFWCFLVGADEAEAQWVQDSTWIWDLQGHLHVDGLHSFVDHVCKDRRWIESWTLREGCAGHLFPYFDRAI